MNIYIANAEYLPEKESEQEKYRLTIFFDVGNGFDDKGFNSSKSTPDKKALLAIFNALHDKLPASRGRDYGDVSMALIRNGNRLVLELVDDCVSFELMEQAVHAGDAAYEKKELEQATAAGVIPVQTVSEEDLTAFATEHRSKF